jgi:hypothetical protein
MKSKSFSFFVFFFFSLIYHQKCHIFLNTALLRKIRTYASFFTDLALTVTTLVLLITRCYRKSWKRGHLTTLLIPNLTQIS